MIIDNRLRLRFLKEFFVLKIVKLIQLKEVALLFQRFRHLVGYI